MCGGYIEKLRRYINRQPKRQEERRKGKGKKIGETRQRNQRRKMQSTEIKRGKERGRKNRI